MPRRQPTAVPRKYEPLNLRGTTPPEHPTGRLVMVDGSSITHWCPDAKEGDHAWKCPQCGSWFHWSIDEGRWFPAELSA